MRKNLAYSTSYFIGLIPAGVVWVWLKDQAFVAVPVTFITAFIFYKIESFRLSPNYLKFIVNKVSYSIVQLCVIYSVHEYFKLQEVGDSISVPILIYAISSATGIAVMIGVGEYYGLEEEYLE